MAETNERRLGSMHGGWLFLFKVWLSLQTVFIPWTVWVTSNVYEYKGWQAQGPRFTQDQAAALETRVMAATDSKIAILGGSISADLGEMKLMIAKFPDSMPPQWWEDWVREKFREQDDRIKELEHKNGVTQ